MASALALLKSGGRHMELVPQHRGRLAAAGEVAIGVTANALAGGLVSYGIGRVYHQHYDKWYGRHLPKLVGGVGKLLAVILGAFTGGGIWTGLADTIGQTGVNALALEMGLKDAREKTGKRVIMLPKGTALPAGAEDISDRIGDLPAADRGRGMSWDQIERLASMR